MMRLQLLPEVGEPPATRVSRCPVEVTLDAIGGKWKPLIIYHLLDGTKRFGELQRRLPMASRRMLTQHLRELEADGLVHREVYAEVPPRVDYSLTEFGRSLEPLLDGMLQWGLLYLEQRGELNASEHGDDSYRHSPKAAANGGKTPITPAPHPVGVAPASSD